MRSPRLLVVVLALFLCQSHAQSLPCAAITRNPQVVDALMEMNQQDDAGTEPVSIPAKALRDLKFGAIAVEPGDGLYIEYKGRDFTIYTEYAGRHNGAIDSPPQ